MGLLQAFLGGDSYHRGEPRDGRGEGRGGGKAALIRKKLCFPSLCRSAQQSERRTVQGKRGVS